MNKIITKFLLPGDKFMPELYLKQPGLFIYSACGPFTKHRERIQKLRETGDLKHLYRNELGKACFAHNVAYSNGKDLAKRNISDKILKDRAYEIARNCGYDGYQRALASMVYKVFDKKTGSGISVNEQLVEELHKAVIKKSKKRKVYTRFKDNIGAADLVEMGSLSSKIKKVKTVLNAFTEIVSESSHKPNKLCVDQGSEFYNKLMQE